MTKALAPNLRQSLQQNFSILDRLLTRLSAILSTTSGTDTTLCTLAYTLSLLHIRLDRHLTARLQRIAVHLAKTASDALLPGETVIATVDLLNTAALESTNGKSTALAAVAADTGLLSLTRLARLTASTKALVDLLSEVRVFMRLWGLLGIYQSAKRLYLLQRKPLSSQGSSAGKQQHIGFRSYLPVLRKIPRRCVDKLFDLLPDVLRTGPPVPN